MKASRCRGLLLLIAFCMGPHSTTLAQQLDSNIEVRTSLGGSADTTKLTFVDGGYIGDHETDSYNNPTDITMDIDTVLGGIKHVETHDEWIGATDNATAVASATAHSKPGDLGVSVSGITSQTTECCDFRHVPTKYGTADVSGRADAFWTDGILINYPDLPVGTIIRMRSSLTLDGKISAGGSGGTSTVTIGAGVVFFDANNNIATFGTSGSASFNGSTLAIIPSATTIPIFYPIQNGIRNSLFFQLTLIGESHAVSALSEASNNGAGYGGDYSGSMHWGGIQDIEDANGKILTGWTVTSDSGFDFTQPYTVPEAGTGLLAAQALVFSGLRRGRRIAE